MSQDDRARLEALIDEFTPEVAAVARGALAALERRLPGAEVLVYDAYNALAIGLGAGGGRKGLFIHLPVYPRWVNLGFHEGARLDDPEGLLVGAGSTVRHIRLKSGDDISAPAIDALIAQAAERAGFVPGVGNPVTLMPWNGGKRPRRP
ncbi:MAG: DUF1801 domain-containing protein [Proteobacteria bacterium]|nr:DUF1801 domain-containing protein [Pseudomonadota bacterium]